jgi:choline dehydrogenase-like flavoprotein
VELLGDLEGLGDVSVADARRQLHDTPGVWIGDASGFPTASGTKPMVSVFALAHRTAWFIAADHVERAAGRVAAMTVN